MISAQTRFPRWSRGKTGEWRQASFMPDKDRPREFFIVRRAASSHDGLAGVVRCDAS
jgi:hypothetical protein